MWNVTSTIRILRLCGFVLLFAGIIFIIFSIIYMMRHRSLANRYNENPLKTQNKIDKKPKEKLQKEDQRIEEPTHSQVLISIQDQDEEITADITEKLSQKNKPVSVECDQQNNNFYEYEEDEDGLNPTAPLWHSDKMTDKDVAEEESNMLLEDTNGSEETEDLSSTSKLKTEVLDEQHRNFVVLASQKSSLENQF